MPLLSFLFSHQVMSQNDLELTGTLTDSVDHSACTITSTQVLDTGSVSVYTASEEISLKPGFYAKAGTEFLASIGGECDPLTISYSKQDETPSGKGSIQLNVSGGTPGYSYLWGNGITADNLQNLDAGTYSVTVTDQDGGTATDTIMILFKDTRDVVWQDIPAGLLVTETSYFKPYVDPEETLLGCNLLAADSSGFVEFTLNQNLGQEEWFYVGLIEDGINPDNSNDADYLVRVLNDTVRAYEKGVVKLGQVATGTAGDRFRIERSGTTVTYSMNGTAFETSTVPAGQALRPVMFLLRQNSQNLLDVDVEASFPCPVLRARYFTEDAVYPQGGGNINLIPEGGSPPYTYNWSNGSTLEDLGNVPEGTYNVTVMDAAGLTATAEIDLFQLVDAVWKPMPDGIVVKNDDTYYAHFNKPVVSDEIALGCFEFSPDTQAKIKITLLEDLDYGDLFTIGFRDTLKGRSANDQYGFYGFRMNAFENGMQLVEDITSHTVGELDTVDVYHNKFNTYEYAVVLKNREVIYYKNQKELFRATVPPAIQKMEMDAYFSSTLADGLAIDIKTSIGPDGLVTCGGQKDCTAFLPDSVSMGNTTTLFPGDITFAAFKDGGLNGADTISLKVKKAIKPGTSFTIANVVYEAGQLPFQQSDMWYSGRGLDSSDIASQRITFTGTKDIPANFTFSFELPTIGTGSDLLARNFRVNTTATPEICTANNGNTPDPNLDISTTVPTAIYLLQGDWHFTPGHALFYGRPIAAMQTVAPFFTLADEVTSHSGISRFYLDLECVSTESLGQSSLLANDDKGPKEAAAANFKEKTSSVTPLPGGGGLLAYPNPFSDGFTLQLELEKAQEVSVRLFNPMGQIVKSMAALELGAGVHSVPVNPEGHISSGVYLLQVQLEEGDVVLRMVKE